METRLKFLKLGIIISLITFILLHIVSLRPFQMQSLAMGLSGLAISFIMANLSYAEWKHPKSNLHILSAIFLMPVYTLNILLK